MSKIICSYIYEYVRINNTIHLTCEKSINALHLPIYSDNSMTNSTIQLIYK
jgi:hypothetical protein